VSSGSGTPPYLIQPLPGHAERTPPGELPVDRDAAAEDRRRRILTAVAELVSKRGYHATTLDLIVRRAHVGYPAFYKCFADKEAAYLALFDAAAARAERLIRDAASPEPARPWPEAVAAALSALFDAIAEHPLLARACLVEVMTAGSAAVARYEQALHALARILLPGRRFNPRAAELSDTLEDTLAGGVAWIVYQRLVAGEVERIPALLPETLEFVLMPYLGEAETDRAVRELTGAGEGAPAAPPTEGPCL
jgi:AcrR family transcriptional regulator